MEFTGYILTWLPAGRVSTRYYIGMLEGVVPAFRFDRSEAVTFDSHDDAEAMQAQCPEGTLIAHDSKADS